MKKSLFIVLLCLVANITTAQHTVIPIRLQLTDLNLDSLKVTGSLDYNAYLLSLEQLFSTINAEDNQLQLIANQLKSEKSYHKAQQKLLKEREQQIKAQEKILKTERKLHQKTRKSIDKDRKTLRKDQALDRVALDKALREIELLEGRTLQAEQSLQRRFNALNQERERLKNDLIALQNYKFALQSKENELGRLKSQHKLTKETLQHEIKATKRILKH